MHKRLTTWALSIAAGGAVSSFVGVYRVEQMFSENGVSLGYGKYAAWYWSSFSEWGMGLFFLSFVIEIAALHCCQTDTQPKHHEQAEATTNPVISQVAESAHKNSK